MARSTIRLEEAENEMFHINYFYMWKKLNTAPYYVSGFGEIPEWIQEEYLLPSYVNLSKCMNPQYVPSMNIVNKIVQFYNANIKPEIDTYEFLHENLADHDSKRNAENAKQAELYSGRYTCYYYAGIDDEKQVYGACMKLFCAGTNTLAYMITGLMSKEDLKNPKLLALLRKDDISVEEYKEFKESLPLSKRRTTLYKGIASTVPGIMTIQFQNFEKEGNMLTLRMGLTSQIEDVYVGGLGLVSMLTSDYNMQILKMAVANAELSEIPMLDFDDERLQQFLDIKKTTNEHIHLSIKENSQWNDYLIAQSEKGQ